jgi:hypothetical protein
MLTTVTQENGINLYGLITLTSRDGNQDIGRFILENKFLKENK